MTTNATPIHNAAGIVIYGPAGCGMSRNAAALAAHYGKTMVIDEWAPGDALPENAIALTNVIPNRAQLRNAIPFAEAIRAVGLAAAERDQHFADQWAAAATSGNSPYLERKKITAPAVRYGADGSVLIPVAEFTEDRLHRLVGLQTISPDGTKLFSKGMAIYGAFCPVGHAADDDKLVFIAEDYAAARSISMAMDGTVAGYAALTLSNLRSLARVVRKRHPEAHILICANDDFLTAPPFHNVGVATAMKAAGEVGNASVVWPRFANRGDNKWTDFNDLHCAESLEQCREQLVPIISGLLRFGRGARPRTTRTG